MTTPTLAQAANARHSSASNEHYTPPQIVEASRATMGGIDLDPASCALANEVVQARFWFDIAARAREWGTQAPHASPSYQQPSRFFVNPPGGWLGRSSLEPLPLGPEGKPSRAGGSA